MRIATWNINSVRARVDRAVALLDRQEIDVLALQEIKCKPEQFPREAFEEAGYAVAVHGHNQWNGVALISRVGLADVRREIPDLPAWGEPPAQEARQISALVGEQGVRVWSLYIPNGREIDHPHYHYKLRWLEAIRAEGARELEADPGAKVVFMGDFNVAPRDEDVWDMAFFEGKTHVTKPERDAFQRIVDAGYADLARPYTPGPGTYTYWDYQQLRFPKKEGMRIDFALGSPALEKHVRNAWIDRDERKGKGASDHAPVVIDIED